VKIRIAAAALAGVASLAMIGMAAAAPGASASTASAMTVSHVIYTPRACTVGRLSARLSGPVWGAHRTDTLTLTNIGNRACTLYGYPGLQLLNSRYQPLLTTTIRIYNRMPYRFPIVLLPGQSATATISYSVYRPWYGWNYTGPRFFGASAAYLVVTLPGTPPFGLWQHFWWQHHFVLRIPGSPARIVQNRLYETMLAGPPLFIW